MVVTHGMGSQGPGFANGMIAEVNVRLERLGRDPLEIAWTQVHWGDITEAKQLAYLAAAKQQFGAEWMRLRGFVVKAFGDAAAYQRTGEYGTYEEIHNRFASAIHDLYVGKLRSSPVPMIVMGHSLGSHILSNYIWDVQRQNSLMSDSVDTSSPFERMDWLAGVITFGSNLPLFTFALDRVKPITFPPTRLKQPLKALARWINMYDPDDVLGYPLGPLSPEYRVLVDDREIQVGGPLGWSPASHVGYWTDNDFTRPVADYLADFL